MNLRYLFVLGTASLLIPIASAIAFGQTESAPRGTEPPFSRDRQGSDCPPPPPGMGDRPPRPMGEGQRGRNPEPRWAKDLNLSTEQRNRIKAIHEQENKDTEELREQMREAHQEMRSLIDSDTGSEQLRSQHQKIQTIRQKLDTRHFEMMLAERQILTPSQRTELGKLMQQRQGRPPR